MDNTPSEPPPRLYKFCAFTTQNLKNLKNQVIYFSSPRQFNDPYDCSITPNISVPSDADVEGIRAKYLSEGNLPGAVRTQMEAATTEQLRHLFMNSARAVTAAKVEEFNCSRGVSCFSESKEDLLMWAHYGGNYKGYCMEFDSAYFPKLHKVRYSAELPAFDLVPILNQEIDAYDFMHAFSSKSPSWSYEKEWRLFHAEAGTSYCYEPAALTGIYFGPEIDSAALEIICLILQGQNRNVAFWSGKRSQEEFKVDFSRFNYIPFLQTKDRNALHL